MEPGQFRAEHVEEVFRDIKTVSVTRLLENGKLGQWLEIDDPIALRDLRSAFQVNKDTMSGHATTMGSPIIKFSPSDTVVSIIHAEAIRWEGRWLYDGTLLDPTKLAEWLARFGFSETQRQLENLKVEGERVRALLASWKQNMPNCLTLFEEQMRADPWMETSPLLAALSENFPCQAQIAFALLCWYGSAQDYSKYTQSLVVTSERLLSQISIESLVESAELGDVTHGLARLFASRTFLKKRSSDLGKLPPLLKTKLVNHLKFSQDPRRSKLDEILARE
jgi:hypothetical protein